MNDSVEIARLARANPVEVGPPGPVPTPPGTPGRARRHPRILGPALGLAGAAGLIALIAALIIAGPAAEEDAPTTFDGTLRVSVLDRPQTERDRADVSWAPLSIDPASTRRVLDRGDTSWFIARMKGNPSSICLVQPGPESLGCWGDVRLERTGMLAERWRPEGTRRVAGSRPSEVVVVVPDGIRTVTAGRATAEVHDNVAALTFPGRPPAIMVLSGPAAVAIQPLQGAAVVTSTGPGSGVPVPVVPVRFTYLSSEATVASGTRYTTGTPRVPTVEGTLAEAVAAVPFIVYVPDPAPTGGELRVSYSRNDPEIFPQVILSYFPATTGRGITVLEGAARGKPGAHGAERTVVRDGRERYVSGEGDPSGQVSVRLVLDGTDVQMDGAPLPDLLAIADTLTPVAP